MRGPTRPSICAGKGDLDWEALGAIAELLGAIAVFATLVYLSIQIRTNTKATKAQAIAAWATASAPDRELLINNPDFLRIAVRLGQDYKPESVEELIAFGAYFRQFLNTWEILFLQNKLGVVDQDFLDGKAEGYAGVVRFPGVKQWWETDGRRTYQSEFADHVDEWLHRSPD